MGRRSSSSGSLIIISVVLFTRAFVRSCIEWRHLLLSSSNYFLSSTFTSSSTTNDVQWMYRVFHLHSLHCYGWVCLQNPTCLVTGQLRSFRDVTSAHCARASLAGASAGTSVTQRRSLNSVWRWRLSDLLQIQTRKGRDIAYQSSRLLRSYHWHSHAKTSHLQSKLVDTYYVLLHSISWKFCKVFTVRKAIVWMVSRSLVTF